MSSTFVADTTDDSSSAGNTVIIIVNDDTGNISVDQEMLQQLLTSQENTTLSVVRVNEAAGDSSTDVNMTVEEIYNPVSGGVLKEEPEEPMETDQEVVQVNGNAKAVLKINEHGLETADPLLALDQEEIEKIEHALQAEQAGQFFGNILPQEAGLDDILDPELTGDPDDSEAVASISLDHCYSATVGTTTNHARNADSAMSSEIDSSDSVSTGRGGSRRQPSPKRRSQRQIDKQEMEQLRRIRKENEELLKKEKEEMNQIHQASPAKKEPEPELEDPHFVAVSEPVAPESTPPQPLSRLAVIRQELQQKILSVDPVKAKVHTPQQPVKTPISKIHLVNKPPQVAQIKSPPIIEAKSPSIVPAKSSPVATRTPQSPQKANSGRQSPVSRVSTSGGVARPRRENRQPPKHLRDAFNQLEFEGIERLVKKTSIKGVGSPEVSTTKIIDDSISEAEKPSESIVSSPSKKDQSKDDDDDDDDDFDDVMSGDGFDSDEDEDDPDRLWCVCREPHNNRFMICCDKCEDWFHGKCVGVTRAMGRQLEIKGLEWICPKCVRQEFAATQGPFVHLHDIELPVKADTVVEEKSPVAKSVDKTDPQSPDPAVKAAKEKAKLKAQTTQPRVRVNSGGSGTADEPVAVPRRCVVVGCKNDARTNSVYCSDACIVTHARDSLMAMSKEKTKQAQLQAEPPTPSTPVTPTGPSSGAAKWKESVEFGQLMSQPTPPLSSKSKAINQLKKSISSDGSVAKPANLADDTPVPVMERKSGKILTGSSAPKVANLEQWLKDNATYEVIKPASLPRPNKPRLPSLSSTPTASSPLTTKAASPATPTSTGQVPSPASSLNKNKLGSGTKKPMVDSSKQPKVIRKRSIESSKDEETPKKVQSDPESTRASAKSSLKDALWNRCKEATDLETDEQTVEQVATEVEEALYRLFNKDVGTKYKSKYRSLIFNIKDPKNLGLFRKIVEKEITPGQLVKMTGEELASKELAEWRERETKHQLDIIQKTELELMSMSNKYLVKTHKGEEIIEEAGKELDENESATSTTTIAPAPLLEALQDTTSKHKSHLFDLNCQICSGKIKEDELNAENNDKDKASSSSSSTSRHKNDKSSKSSSHRSESNSKRSERDRRDHRDRDKKKRDHDKDRSHHRSSSRNKDNKDRHHRHRSDKDKDNKADKAKIDQDKSKDKERKKDEPKKDDVKKEEVASVGSEPVKEEVKTEACVKEDITTTTSNESEALPATSAHNNITDAQPIQEKKKKKEDEDDEPVSKQEPTSTVSIKTPEQQPSPPESGPIVWKGVINSPDSGKVNVQALDMSGSTDLADLEIPSSLDVVGRIRPEMVWDYVNQTRRVGSRDIVVFKFVPASDADRKHYLSFLSHMYKSNRFAVVGAISKLIKDFYVVPLPKDSPIPLALAALSQGTKTLDENRTSGLLLGVVVRTGTRRKRTGEQATNEGVPVPSKAAKLAKASAKSTPPSTSNNSSPSLNYIPTSRSNSKKTNSKTEQVVRHSSTTESSTKDQTDDAPYSPGQLIDEEPIPVVVDEKLLKHQAMLEDLNRQIEAEKQELASLSTEVTTTKSPEVMIPGLGEPVIPGLGEPSTSSTTGWTNTNTRVTPMSDPPFDHSAKATPSSALNLNLSNLQEIISTIQKKEMEMKLTGKAAEQPPAVSDRPLPTELFSPHDVDMRIAGPIPAVQPPVTPIQPVVAKPVLPVVAAGPEKKKPSLLNQLTDEELLAKAMEMEMEQAGIPGGAAPVTPGAPPMTGPPFFSPPRGANPYGPMGMPPMGGPPMRGPPMMGHPRQFHSPPFMGQRPPYHSPPPGQQQGGFRPRHNKKKR